MFLGSKNQGGRPVKPADERRSYSITVKFTMELDATQGVRPRATLDRLAKYCEAHGVDLVIQYPCTSMEI